MCGITGILNFDKDSFIEKDKLKRMTDVISHRGPDGEGFYTNKNVGLGHRRLSIIDLEQGSQPMISEDGRIIVVFNGEIYNYIEIRKLLENKGHVFRTNSDTEVILKSYEEWGYECQNKFNGMWAFGLWDNSKEILFLSRDRVGEKPLHYSVFENSFVFGSELKSLFEYGVPKTPDYSWLEIYLIMTNIPEPNTFYKNIFKLKAGHYLIIKNKKIHEYKYWDLPEIDELNMNKNKNQIYDEFESILNDSVKIRMRSDVPFGAFLSGGLDSSAIVSLMTKNSDYKVNTFTIGFPQSEFDESIIANSVAQEFGTNHLNGTVDPDEFDEIINKVNFHFDEPFGDASSIPTGYVSNFAAQKVKMVLTGDGGDEVLSGYNSYAGIKFAQKFQKTPHFFQNSSSKLLSNMKGFSSGKMRLQFNRIENVIKTSALPFNERIIQKRSYTDFSSIKKLVSNVKDMYPIEEFFSSFMDKCSYKDEFYKNMYINFKLDLPNKYLVKVDRMSMSHSLETRTPFLDYRLIEFMANVHKDVKMQGWERKSVLRNSVGKVLPKSVLNAPKKGFDVPLREWFKDRTFENRIRDNLRNVNLLLDKAEVKKIVEDNNNGLIDNGNFIWSLMMLNECV